MLAAASHLWGVISKAAAVAIGRVKMMLGDAKLVTLALFTFTFTNLMMNLYAAIRFRQGHFLLKALEGLGTTLGGSLGQIIVGLEVFASGQVFSISGIKGIVALLLGFSTIYIYFKVNYELINWASETQIRLTDHLYITLVLVFAVAAYHDASQFYEAINLTMEVGDTVIGFAPDTTGGLNETMNQTANQTVNQTQ